MRLSFGLVSEVTPMVQDNDFIEVLCIGRRKAGKGVLCREPTLSSCREVEFLWEKPVVQDDPIDCAPGDAGKTGRGSFWGCIGAFTSLVVWLW